MSLRGMYRKQGSSPSHLPQAVQTGAGPPHGCGGDAFQRQPKEVAGRPKLNYTEPSRRSVQLPMPIRPIFTS